MTAASARTTAADAAVTGSGCASCGARRAARITAVLPATWRRCPRLSAALICAVVSFAADAGSGAFASSSSTSAEMKVGFEKYYLRKSRHGYVRLP